MGLFSRAKPKIKVRTSKKDGFSGWLKCTHCDELIHAKELQSNLNCCPQCGYHYRLSVQERIKNILDADSFQELFPEIVSKDPLKFEDSISYKERLDKANDTADGTEAITVGTGTIDDKKVAIAVLDFSFMAGSMGSVVGERLTLLIEYAEKKNYPLIIISASGGARMQESTLSLMQMAKTSAALSRFDKKGLLFVSVLTNPTTGGVTASFASLGDVILAEPDALICFAGPRVIEQTIGQKLPPGAQRSEFLLKHGMIDAIVPRYELRASLSQLVHFFVQDPEKAKLKKEKPMPHKLEEFLKLELED
ncbi:MAG: acetyl-CoA carboxylase, carboxyltransferase subunit beta [Chlamydiales bacterium]|nr:acetyl-CoA carboxylase, carboxyltransferase subunit beta [Chlamydiales bacterium]